MTHERETCPRVAEDGIQFLGEGKFLAKESTKGVRLGAQASRTLKASRSEGWAVEPQSTSSLLGGGGLSPANPHLQQGRGLPSLPQHTPAGLGITLQRDSPRDLSLLLHPRLGHPGNSTLGLDVKNPAGTLLRKTKT